ncbi:MAG TPA: PAS domain S-box protein [Longimicrobium sp.]|uniref:hybrid sensor histidine kinase/response regulator n=1 Tax=Longimicrobium sp. TaxID=2029185 RepID=UPI002ED7F0E7
MQATLPVTETLFARAPVPLWVVDAGTGEVLDVNDAACRAFGYTRCQFLDLGPGEIGPLPPPNGHGAARRLRRGDGSEIHAELAAEWVEVEGRPAWLVSAHDVTTRVDAERERLQAERARFDALFRDAPAMVAAVEGPDHVFTVANEPYQRLVGRSDLLGKPVREALPDLEGQGFFELLDRVYQTGEPFVATAVPIRMQHRRGVPVEERFVSFVYQPVRGARGQVTGIFAHVVDVTEEVRMEAALRRSEARFERIASKVPGMVYQFALHPDGSTSWPYVSEGASSLCEVDRAYVEQNPSFMLELVLPEDRPALHAAIAASAATLQDFRWDGRIRTPSGDVRTVYATSRPERHPDGTVVWDGLMLDATDRVRAAEELRQSEERFRIAARATNDVVWDWDLVLGRLVWNEALETVLGHRKSGAQGAADWWIQQLHPDDQERVVAGLYEVVDGNGASWHDEYRIRRGDGGWATVLDRGYVLRDPDGTAVRMIGAMEDITRRKQLEAQLVDAKRLESVGRLAGGVAHDFNNLLTAITGYTEMLLSDVEPGGEMHADLMEIRNAAARATGLTRQLLAFSRRQVLQPRVLNLNATIRDLERMFRRLLREDVRLQVELDPAAGQVRADPAQVEQVLLNLAVNARDAMPAGGTLRIATRAAVVGAGDGLCAPPVNLKPGRYVVISASDTGEGIAPEVLPQIFEPFFTTKPAGLGTGLGLATVYGIIKQSGGTVWAESEPGRGATFHVYLPATDELPGAVTALPARTPTAGTGTVLLVDDDAAVRTFVRTVLSGAGYRVMDAADGAQALHVAAECDGALDLLLTDVVMPRMGGRDLADEVARRWPGLPTLFMSGYTDDALADHGVLDPTVMLLEKPFSREALLEHVREALTRGAVVSAG